jgi:hypothetical protein
VTKLRLGRVKRAETAPVDGLIERPNASFGLDGTKLRGHLFTAESPGDQDTRRRQKPSRNEWRAERDRLAQDPSPSAKLQLSVSKKSASPNLQGFTANLFRLVVSIGWAKVTTAGAICSVFPTLTCRERSPKTAAFIAVETSFARSISGSAKLAVRFVTRPKDEFDAQPQRPRRVALERQLGKRVSCAEPSALPVGLPGRMLFERFANGIGRCR